MADLPLEDWEQAANDATPGPWQIDGPYWWEGGDVNPHCSPLLTTSERRTPVVIGPEHQDSADDLRFIAAARDAVPQLIVEVHRLRSELAAVQAENERLKVENEALRPGAIETALRRPDAALRAALGRFKVGSDPGFVMPDITEDSDG